MGSLQVNDAVEAGIRCMDQHIESDEPVRIGRQCDRGLKAGKEQLTATQPHIGSRKSGLCRPQRTNRKQRPPPGG